MDRRTQRLEREELHQPSVMLAGSAMGVLRGAVGFTALFAAFAFRDDKLVLGLVAVFAVTGALIGNLAAPSLRSFAREEVMLSGALLGAAVVTFLGALLGGSFGVGVAALAIAIGSATGKLGFDSLLQRDGPDAVPRARVRDVRGAVPDHVGVRRAARPDPGQQTGRPLRPGDRDAVRWHLLCRRTPRRTRSGEPVQAPARRRRPRLRPGEAGRAREDAAYATRRAARRRGLPTAARQTDRRQSGQPQVGRPRGQLEGPTPEPAEPPDVFPGGS